MTISEEDIQRLSEKFVTKDHCTERHDKVDAAHTELRVAYTETKTQFRMVMAMLASIATIVAGILAKMLIGG